MTERIQVTKDGTMRLAAPAIIFIAFVTKNMSGYLKSIYSSVNLREKENPIHQMALNLGLGYECGSGLL